MDLVSQPPTHHTDRSVSFLVEVNSMSNYDSHTHDNTHAQITEYLRLHPTTSAVEAIGATGADPSVWLDAVKAALETERPHTSIVDVEAKTGGQRRYETETDSPDDTDVRTQKNIHPPTTRKGDRENGECVERQFGEWSSADFTTTVSDRYPSELLDVKQWMGRKGKLPFALWGNRNHPDGDSEKDARYKWGIKDMYVEGKAIAMYEIDPELDGRVFIQLETDPYAFVDGDDVRCPKTGEVHPTFIALLSQLGWTYADISTSGSGVHAYYKGELPIDGKGQATFEIDAEPWGENDSPPTVEIYANKHVCVTTGEQVEGTPDKVTEWDSETLRTILQVNGYRDKEPVDHTSNVERLEGYEPTVTAPDETAEDMRDVYAAVGQLRPLDLPLRTVKTGTDSTGWTTWNPSYRTSSSGQSLHYSGEGAFYDHKEGESFNVLQLFAAEQGIISNPWDRLTGRDWLDAIEQAREYDAHIPKPPETQSGGEPTVVLPPAVRDLSSVSSGWDWRHTAEHRADDLSIQSVRDRTTDAIADAYGGGDRVLIEALPTMGKSYGAIKAAEKTGESVTVLTGRGHKEQYGQFKQWCDEFGLSYYQLPSFARDCETANGEYGEQWRETVVDLYRRGATPQQIHKAAEHVFDDRLPCQQDGHTCSYTAQWDFDPDDYDVLIGHYSHAYQGKKVVHGRTVVFDEFTDSYEDGFCETFQQAVSHWLSTTPGVPFDNYTDLLENRSDDERRGEAVAWFDEHGVDTDENHVFDDSKAHAKAPVVVYTILAGESLENGWETATFGRASIGAFDRMNGRIHILQPPNLRYAKAVVALDGTPTKKMWEISLGERLNHRPILQGSERTEYIRDALNLNITKTTEHVKPYNSNDHVNVESDTALLEAIGERHGENAGVITSSTAKAQYKRDGVDRYTDGIRQYGNVLGSNDYKEKRVGAVIGSNHYGDDYVKKWGAYAGVAVENPDRTNPSNRGKKLSYGNFGDSILHHMREHDTLQATMRFGRDGNGAVVYVHTDTLPNWVPIAGEGRVLRTYSDGERQVLDAIGELDSWRTAEIAEHPAVSIGKRQVFNVLDRLSDRGVVEKEYAGRGYVWLDDGLHRISDHGEVELPTIDVDELGEGEIQEITRSSIYTWKFLNTPKEPDVLHESVSDVSPPSHVERQEREIDPPKKPS